MYYSIAEALNQGHSTLIVCKEDEDAAKLLHQLPFNVNRGITQVSENLEEKNPASHLNIAWQYGKYITNSKFSLIYTYIHVS
jgi:hypothetical protein